MLMCLWNTEALERSYTLRLSLLILSMQIHGGGWWGCWSRSQLTLSALQCILYLFFFFYEKMLNTVDRQIAILQV